MYSNETTLYKAILIASVIIGSIIIYFIVSIIRQQKRYRTLDKKKLEAEINTIESERKRIASDIHDELGAVLSAVKFKISSIDIVSPADEESINQSLAHIDDIIKKVRHIANNLTPAILSRKGLVYAIRDHIDNTINGSGLKVSLIPYNMPELSPYQQIHIYRILQEIINNTFKHAKARGLKIELYSNKNKLVILSCDNGIGFDSKNAQHAFSGLGLQTLQTRTDILGGEMYINSKPGKGTRYRIEIPLINLNQPL